MAGFYGNLFTVEITVLGIIAAAAFAFLQILHSNFSYGHLVSFLKRPSFILYGISSFVVAAITATGFLLLSLDQHDFFPSYYLQSNVFFQNDWVSLFVLVIFFASIILGLVVIFSSISHLNPANILVLQRKRISNVLLKKFLFKKYGIPSLNTFMIQREIYAGMDMKVLGGKIRLIIPSDDADDNSEPEDFFTPEEKAEIERREKIAEAKITKATTERSKLEKDIENTPDIFEDLSSFLARAIAAGDTSSLQRYSAQILDICTKFIEYVSSESSKADESPDKELPAYFANYIGELLATQLELCDRHKLPSFAPSFVTTNKAIALHLVEKKYDGAVHDLLSYWKDAADQAMKAGNRALFNELMVSYREIAKTSLETSKKDPVRDSSSRELPHDEVFRHLGWLAERLLTTKELEEKPVMYDGDYRNEYDSLFNALFGFSHDYSYNYLESYPLAFFDAVQCFCERLLEVYIKETRENLKYQLKNHLFDCYWAFGSFAREAIQKGGNGRSVGLAAIKLKMTYDETVKLGADEPAKDAIALIVDVAMASAMNPENTKSDLMSGKTADEYLEETILESPYREAIRNEVFERYIKIHEGDHDKKWGYITSLGRKMGTNFGFMFDPATGELYPENDPRRR